MSKEFDDFKDFLGGAYNGQTHEVDVKKLKQIILNRKDKINIILFGATGVGKSSLINAVFGEGVAKTGAGEPVTQNLEKFSVPEKGLTLWDTKGIEAQDYDSTKEQLIKNIREGMKNALELGKDDFPHVAWLCIKEGSARIENREYDLLNIAKEFGIPTVVVFTDTQYEKGNEFFENAKKAFIDKGYAGFLKNRICRVNSVSYSMTIAGQNINIPTSGLDDLLKLTEDCLDEAIDNMAEHQKQHNQDRIKRLNAFRMAQEVDLEKKRQTIKESARKKVHLAAIAAGGVGASPIPGSDAPLIAAVQTAMIHTLNIEFQLDEENAQSTAVIAGILGVTAVAQVGKSIVSNVLKFIPVVGTVAGGVISASTAVALTEAIGHAYIEVLDCFYDKKAGKTIFPKELEKIMALFKQSFHFKK